MLTLLFRVFPAGSTRTRRLISVPRQTAAARWGSPQTETRQKRQPPPALAAWKQRQTHMTSVQTIVVELATEVCCRDSKLQHKINRQKKAAVTAADASEYFTNMEDSKIPRIPIRIMLIGYFWAAFTFSSPPPGAHTFQKFSIFTRYFNCKSTENLFFRGGNLFLSGLHKRKTHFLINPVLSVEILEKALTLQEK